jgi:hypothetical protein
MRMTPWLAGLAACALPQTVAGQVIQLPSFHSFSVDTTVVVPDAGRAPIAGNRQGRTGVSRVGPLSANRTVGVDRQATGASALAAIHDPRQADAALRRRAQEQHRAALDDSARSAAPWAGRTAASDRPLQSARTIEGERTSRTAAIERETLALIARARAAAAKGQPGVAKIYYQRAAAQATGQLPHTIAAELATLNRAPAVSRKAVDRSALEGRTVAGARR